MKKLATLFSFCLMTLNAHASLEIQMEGIQGDWSKGWILRAEKQTEDSIIVSLCDGNIYNNSTNRTCSATTVKLFNYRSDLDAFVTPAKGSSCSSSLQVSASNPPKLVWLSDPYGTDRHCFLYPDEIQILKKL